VLTRRSTVAHLREPALPADAVNMELFPLAEPAMVEILADLLDGPPTDEQLGLCAVASGNPANLVRLVEEDRDAPFDDWRLHATVRRQLGQVSVTARHLTQVAAVGGRSVKVEDLTDMFGAGAASLLPAVEEVLASGMLVCDGEHLAFRHEVVRAIVAESLPRSLRVALQSEVRDRGEPRTVPLEPDHTPVTTRWGSLSDQELAIARLVAQAMTNQQIASRMHLSHHTVNYHLRQIFRKLDITSRVQLAALTPARWMKDGHR
jgi:DNA-binding CsgD family transcriptional regulator